jgi:hypothetical protein
VSDKTPEEPRNEQVIRSLIQRIIVVGVHNLNAAKSAIVATLGIAVAAGYAYAADQNLPVKAPLPTVDQLDVHAYFDLSLTNDYVTVNGLFSSRTGLTTQIVDGLIFDIYKDKGGFINDVSLDLGTYNNLFSSQNDPHVGAWKEFNWWVKGTLTMARDWTFGSEYREVLSPAADLPTNPPGISRNWTFSLNYNDSWTGWPITFNPYVKLQDHTSGPSGAILGQTSNALDGFFGMTPTIDLMKYVGIAVTLSAPTSFTVGPSNYWNRNDGTTNFCAPPSTPAGGPRAPCSLSNFGYFTTGLSGLTPLTSLIPQRLGNWSVKYGFQYYYIINDALLAAQEFTAGASGNSMVNGTFSETRRDIFVSFVGMDMVF